MVKQIEKKNKCSKVKKNVKVSSKNANFLNDNSDKFQRDFNSCDILHNFDFCDNGFNLRDNDFNSCDILHDYDFCDNGFNSCCNDFNSCDIFHDFDFCNNDFILHDDDFNSCDIEHFRNFESRDINPCNVDFTSSDSDDEVHNADFQINNDLNEVNEFFIGFSTEKIVTYKNLRKCCVNDDCEIE